MNNELLEITNKIYIIRDQKVMLDRDLALIYGVEVKRLNEQVKRNTERFPEEFCFRLTSEEFSEAKSQNATLVSATSRNYKQPLAFTEQGAYALSFVLRS
jgi:aromatic ring-opening dioxygenase LigB subunit